MEQQQVLSVNTCTALKPTWFIYHRNTQLALKANSCQKEKGAHGRSDVTVNAWQPCERNKPDIPSEASPLTFSIADICEVLTLHYFLYYIVSIDPGVVHSGWVTLH